MQPLRTILLLLALVIVPVVAGPMAAPVMAQSQQAEPIDYEAWERTALRAEEAVEAERASTPALESLRSDLVIWRQTFQREEDANANTIATVERQLSALGPPPEDGSESAQIAQEREQLNARLAQLQAPGKRAELAYSRADGLIQGIDQIIRDRQAEELLEFGPSPGNPTYWADAVTALFDAGTTVVEEFRSGLRNPVQRQETLRKLPLLAALGLVGLLFLVRGRAWSRKLSRRLVRDAETASAWIAAFVVSLGSFVIPVLGFFLLVSMIQASGLAGTRTSQVLDQLMQSAVIFFAARWLAMRVFPIDEMRGLPLNLAPEGRKAGRWYGTSLGFATAILHLLDAMTEIFGWSSSTANVILFPVLVTVAVLLWRLARLLKAHADAGREETGDDTYRAKSSRILVRALVVLAVAAPVLGMVGYFALAKFLLYPSVLSLMMLAALLILQRVVVELYALVTGNLEGAAESLIPVLVGAGLVLMSMPVFALIWGARMTDLTELWTQFVDGIYIGETRLSPVIFLTLAAVFAVGFLATRLLQSALKNTVLPKTRIDMGGRNAIVSGVGYVGIFLAAIIAITSAGIDLSSLAIVAGALSVGIGFGLQNIVSNFVAGIILLIERPISEGDWIEVGGQHGYVRHISVRSTRIETFDRTDVIVPNADFVSGTVTNYTRGNTVGRVIVPVGVAYGTDTRKVEKILQEIAEAHPMVLANPAPAVVFQGFGESSMDFEIRAILRDVNWVLDVKSDMNHEIAKRFTEEGIEIPYAQRDIWLRNPETLTAGASGASTSRMDTPKGSHEARREHDPSDGQGDSDADADGGPT
jgi:potassium efflux system protein